MTGPLGSQARWWRQPIVPLLPTGLLVAALLVGLGAIHVALVAPAQQRVDRLQAEWREARERFVEHVEAKRTIQDLAEVLRIIPAKEGFVPLALGITEEAKRNNVALPSLSYRVEPPSGQLARKAVFEGSATGRYEDLRRFIRRIELAEELLFIEDLDVVRAEAQRGRKVTFKMSIATYLRPKSETPSGTI